MAKVRMASTDRSPATRDDAPTQSALRTLGLETDGISALAQAMRNGLGAPFTKAVDLIRDGRGRVIVSGMGKSGHIGRKIAATLASTGTPAFFVHPGEASHGDLGMITTDDVVLALSWSGETAELKDLIDYSRRFRIGLIAITAKRDSDARPRGRRRPRAAGCARSLPAQPCADHLNAHAACDRRRACHRAAGKPRLHRRRFRRAASGGRLGAMLKFVRDLMHTRRRRAAGRRSARAWRMPSSKCRRKGFGCVGIVDAHGTLAGIITDGDLRRHMRPDLLDALVET